MPYRPPHDPPHDSIGAALRLFRRGLAGEPLAPAERERLATLLGDRDPSIRAMVTVAMADERAGRRLTAAEIRAIAEATRAYAEALAQAAEERAAREADEVSGAALPRLAPEDLAVAPEPEAPVVRRDSFRRDPWPASSPLFPSSLDLRSLP